MHARVRQPGVDIQQSGDIEGRLRVLRAECSRRKELLYRALLTLGSYTTIHNEYTKKNDKTT